MLNEEILYKLKNMVREDTVPYFTDSEIEMYYNECDKDLNATAYRLLIVKSENTTLQVSGLTTGDSSRYFRRLALQYKPNNSGILRG